jgi:hypothetical protein
MIKSFTFQEIIDLYRSSKHPQFAFNHDMHVWHFVLQRVNINDVQQVSIPRLDQLIGNELSHTIKLINAIEIGAELPPIILGYRYSSGYEVKDGVHRLCAYRYLKVHVIEAFVRIN